MQLVLDSRRARAGGTPATPHGAETSSGAPTASATELTEHELDELTAEDEAMELTPKEKEKLAETRQMSARLGSLEGLASLASARGGCERRCVPREGAAWTVPGL